MLAHQQSHPRAVRAVAIAAVALSLALLAGLLVVYVLHGSQLALSQAADSFADALSQFALVASLYVAARPPDEDHHYGHQRAEPIAALVAAVMIGVVSIEVIREAVGALLEASHPAMHWSLPMLFGIKAGAKIVLGVVCWRIDPDPEEHNPVLRAVFVDARNDAVLSLLSIGGYFAAKYGMPSLDAYFAIPIGLWIGWSAIDLATDTLPLLMGEAPSESRQRELDELVVGVEGVRSVRRIRVQHVGVELDLDVHVRVDPELTLRDANAIARRVEQRLVREDDVCSATVRVEPEDSSSLPPAPGEDEGGEPEEQPAEG